MAALNKPIVRAPWASGAGSGDITDPGATYTAAGWPESSTPPSRQYFNWLINYCMNGVRYLSQRGVADYDAAETYYIGDVVIGDRGSLVQSLTNSNTGNTPSTSGSNWSTLANYSSTAQTSAAITSALASYVTQSSLTSQLASYVTTASLNSTLASYATNAALANYLPLSGGTMSGSLTVGNGDLRAYRSGGSAGVVYLGSGNSSYLYFDGTNYSMGVGNLIVNGAVMATVAQYQAGDSSTLSSSENYTNAQLANYLALSGGSLSGTLTIVGDLHVYRSSGNVGVVYLDNTNNHYVYFDGTNYSMPNANLLVNGATVATVAQYQAGDASTLSTAESYTNTGLAAKAPLASPALTGTPTAPTPAAGNSSTQIATTAFVQNTVGTTQIRSGTFNCTNGTVSVSFATAFPQSCSAVCVQWNYANPNVGWVTPSSVSKTGFSYQNGNAGQCYYIAVGF